MFPGPSSPQWDVVVCPAVLTCFPGPVPEYVVVACPAGLICFPGASCPQQGGILPPTVLISFLGAQFGPSCRGLVPGSWGWVGVGAGVGSGSGLVAVSRVWVGDGRVSESVGSVRGRGRDRGWSGRGKRRAGSGSGSESWAGDPPQNIAHTPQEICNTDRLHRTFQ